MKRPAAFLAFLALAWTMAGCATDASTDPRTRSAIFGSIFNEDDLRARQPRQTGGGAVAQSGAVGAVVQYGGGGGGATGLGRLPPALSSPSSGEYNLNFENAGIEEIVRAVLGEALAVNYTISPEVSGTATISTARPVSREELLQTLERVLAFNGASLEGSGDSYAVVPQGAANAGRPSLSREAGFGMTVLPLRYVGADTVVSLIDGFGTRPGAVRVERARNLLVIIGSGPDRRSAAETALSFDVDWMRDQSVGVFPLRRARAESVLPELEQIFSSGEEGVGAQSVQFSRVARLNGILVVARSSDLLSRARLWIDKLDNRDAGMDALVHVYRVKYQNAERLAVLLNDIFANGGSASEEVTATDTPTVLSTGSESAFDRNLADRINGGGEAPATLVGLQSPVVFGAPSSAPLRIRADSSNNSVVIYANQDKRREILSALHQIDVPQLQVAINVTMAEIRLNDDLRYGVQYFLKSNRLGLGSDAGSIGLFGAAANAIGRQVPGFNFILGSEANPDIIIDAFDQITDVQVLSSPSLVVMDNELAQFQVGDQIPVVTRTVTSVQDANAPVSNEVVYRDTGVILKVRPRVSENGVVSMVIEQEISAVTGGAASLTPTISNRLVSSSISVVDGQTVLLGGLISEQADGSKSGIPGLHRMKGIGGLFGRTGQANSRTEVIILIRPTVIRESQDAEHVASELRAKMWGIGSTQAR
ncbi:type II secretion system secretin GspD [Mesorhizobium sp. YIM 152430]|uniref:type II secretion system secretin GspD n=1 Tax=Mesorhizobium sp. YIM 152430 TaxID=3031761 RepID=UPI0023D9E486|nr:type II secretion system secretin GspD [Mesorhizobium sp. YIM 152430]MDF1599299.1 type II secretion system secretin GspD [Mesorhizobium sp. YIM 152430]